MWQLQRNSPWYPDIELNLRGRARDVKSQGGEDGILEHLFTKWWPHHMSERDHRYVVEIGAWDGEHLSNAWNLLRNHSWSGLLVEVNGVHSRATFISSSGHEVHQRF
jgi:hypothetical protein